MKQCFLIFLMIVTLVSTQAMGAEASSTTSTKDVYGRLVEEFDAGNYAEVIKIFDEDMRHRAVIEQRDSTLYYNYSRAMEAAFYRDDLEEARVYLDSLPDSFQKTAAFRFYVIGLLEKEKGEHRNALEALQQAEGIFDSAIHIADLPGHVHERKSTK